MAVWSRVTRGRKSVVDDVNTDDNQHRASDNTTDAIQAEKQITNDEPIRIFRLRIILMGVLVSMGGLIFGYDTGKLTARVPRVSSPAS